MIPVWADDPGLADKEMDTFEAHLSSCPACAVEFEETKEILSNVKEQWGPVSKATDNILLKAGRLRPHRHQIISRPGCLAAVEDSRQDLLVQPAVVAAPAGGQNRRWFLNLLRATAACLAAGMLVWLAFSIHAATKPAGDSTLPPSDLTIGGATEVASAQEPIDPKRWVGKKLPLTRYIDIGKSLEKNTWLVLFYRHDCPNCIEILSRYVRMSRDLVGRKSHLRVALVEMHPYGRRPMENGRFFIAGRLSGMNRWCCPTPVAALLADGNVATTWAGQAAANIDEIFRSITDSEIKGPYLGQNMVGMFWNNVSFI
jgi:hypothetical protein